MAIRLGVFRNLLSSFLKLDPDKLLKKVVSNSSIQQDIISLNTENQLYEKGITADGVSLGEYSQATIYGTSQYEGKIKKGQPYDHVTLKDTGKFDSTFNVKTSSEGIIISADTVKPDRDLMEVYGNILGLTKENKNIAAGWMKVPFCSEVRKAVFK